MKLFSARLLFLCKVILWSGCWWGGIVWSSSALAECRDIDAIAAGETLAKSYFNAPKIFHPGRVLKIHHPSRHKEVSAYVQTADGRHYSIFSLVDENCQARFIKRTRQND